MVKLLSDKTVTDRADIVIIGDPSVITRGEKTVGTTIQRHHVASFDPMLLENGLLHLDLTIDGITEVEPCQVSAAGGKSSLLGLETAFSLSKKEIDKRYMLYAFQQGKHAPRRQSVYG